jgi:hypothetical protein
LDVGLLVLFLGVVLGAEVNLHDLTVPPVQDQLEVEVAAQSAPVTTTTETSFVSDLRDDLSHLKVILKNVSMEASLPALGKEFISQGLFPLLAGLMTGLIDLTVVFFCLCICV